MGAALMGGGGFGGVLGMGGGSPMSMLSGGNTPQQKGYGIGDATMPMAYDTGPGLMPGTPIAGFQNGDLTRAGAAEQQYADTWQRFNAPGAAGNFWEQSRDAMAGPGMGESYAGAQVGRYMGGTPQVANNSQTQYQTSLGAAPDLSANLDPFYANEQRKALEGIDRAMAARGMMGSSASMDRAQEAITNLAADKAKADAQYGLDYSADRRAWQGLQGQMAGQADGTSQAQSNNELSWMRGLGDLALSGQNMGLQRLGQAGQLAGQADSADLSRLNAGMGAASQAQQAQQGRLGSLWDMYSGLGGQLGNMAADSYGQIFDTDMSLLDGQMGMELGLGTLATNQDYRTQQKIKDDADWAMDMFGGVMSGGLTSGIGG